MIAEGRTLTYDLNPSRDDPTAARTSEVAQAVVDKLGWLNELLGRTIGWR